MLVKPGILFFFFYYRATEYTVDTYKHTFPWWENKIISLYVPFFVVFFKIHLILANNCKEFYTNAVVCQFVFVYSTHMKYII